MSRGTLHEELRHDDALVVGSDRKFGLVFVVFFGLVGAVPLLTRDPPELRAWALGVSGAFLTFTLVAPRVLHPLNVLWMRFGLLLGKIVSPIVLGVLFFGAVLPMALVLRALGKDLLRLKRAPEATSYWILRTPPGPAPESLKQQF